MEQQSYLRIQQDPNFQELVAKRQRFAWALSALMLGLYLAFILLIAFAPGWLGTPLSEGSTITRGIPVGRIDPLLLRVDRRLCLSRQRRV